MITLTQEQFKQKYGDAGLSSFDNSQNITPAVSEPSLTDIVGEDINNRVNRVGDIINRQDTGIVTKGVQLFGQGAGLAANTLEQTAMQVPGVKQAVAGIGEGLNWLATSDKSPIKYLGDLIGSNKTLQTAVNLYDTDTNFKDTIDAVANTVRLGGDVDGIVQSANFATNVTNKVIKNVKGSGVGDIVPPDGGGGGTLKVETKPVSVSIMNKVARLNPSDANEFKVLSKGKTVGDYLTETGNFGAPDKIITNEASKFTQSKAMVDAELSKLPGVYKDSSILEALNGLKRTAGEVSSGDIMPNYASKIDDFIKKYDSGGLTMDEINQVKRLYEREVKLGYNRLSTPSNIIKKATLVDDSLRNWQIKKASDLGFKNIQDLNKQTQLSKFIINKLGDKVVGQAMLNGIGLTDWIVLGGGSPQAVASFLTKKFFSSRAVQAKIAELLNIGEPVKGIIQPEVQPTIEANLRRQFPEGNRLELPSPTSNIRSRMPSGEPIKVAPKGSNIEITSGKGITNSSSKPVSQPKSKR